MNISNLEYYRVFYQLVKSGSITAAADSLFLTQPSVTKTLQRLEEQLGCGLFVRTKRGVKLTAEGELLWSRVEPAIDLIVSGERELEAARSLEIGTLSISATEMGFAMYVLPALTTFLAVHPNIKVRFHNSLTGNTVQALKTGLVDIAIFYYPFEPDSSLFVEIIDVFEERLVGGARFAGLSGQKNELSSLEKYPFISMPEGTSGKDYMVREFSRYGLGFEPDIEVTTMELVVKAAANNLGIGTLPQGVAETYLKRGELFEIPLTVPLPKREVYAVTSRDFPPGLLTRAFMEELRG
jgi:DNA-binding transcriptional LysR family regulator